MQLLSTLGVAAEDMNECLQCWCKDDPSIGSTLCCRNCWTQAEGPPQTYFLEYNITWRCDSGFGVRLGPRFFLS